jgi:hypothetical protein
VLAGLRANRWLRSAAGIGCAYALALQMLLAGVVATQMAVAEPANAVICYGNHSGDGGTSGGERIHHAACVVCALASLAAPACDATQAYPLRLAVTADIHFISALPAHAGRRHTPRSSQGPPATA